MDSRRDPRTFRDGKLLMETPVALNPKPLNPETLNPKPSTLNPETLNKETLVELLTGKLRPSELPMVEVLELGGSFYAIEGNRRLWIFQGAQGTPLIALFVRIICLKFQGLNVGFKVLHFF